VKDQDLSGVPSPEFQRGAASCGAPHAAARGLGARPIVLGASALVEVSHGPARMAGLIQGHHLQDLFRRHRVARLEGPP
jgi:hypothetical protein